MNNETILCVSGGIDSYVAWHYLNYPRTVFFDAKTRYSEKERKVVQKLFPNVIIDTSLDLKDREFGEKAYIHQRNLLFAVQASHYGKHIVIAGLKDDMVSDKTPRAFELMTKVLTECGGSPHTVISPFWKMTKEEVVRWFIDREHFDAPVSYSLLETTSCYHPTEHYCGECPSCFRKYIAMCSNGVNIPFHNETIKNVYKQRAIIGGFIPERCASILKVLGN